MYSIKRVGIGKNKILVIFYSVKHVHSLSFTIKSRTGEQ